MDRNRGLAFRRLKLPGNSLSLSLSLSRKATMSHEKDKIIGRLVSRRPKEEGEKRKEEEGGSRTTPPLSSTRGRPRSRIIALIYSRSGAEIPGSFGLITLLNDRAPPASSAGLRLSIEFLQEGGGWRKGWKARRTEHRFPFFRSLLSSAFARLFRP